MKRTGEIVLTVIAAVINLLALVSGVRSVSVEPSDIKQQLGAAKSNLSSQDINSIAHLLNTIGIFLIVLSIISIVIAIIALFLLKPKHKWAGWLLILAAVFSAIEIVPAILYLIAGIMTLVRKPKIQAEIKD